MWDGTSDRMVHTHIPLGTMIWWGFWLGTGTGLKQTEWMLSVKSIRAWQRKEKGMSEVDFLIRFDDYFGHRNDRRTWELRKYLSEYFTLDEKIPEAFVPRIFVMHVKNSSSFTTNITWADNMCTIFPPTDFISIARLDSDLEKGTYLHPVETATILQELSPFLHRLSGYRLTKVLSPEHEYSQEIEDRLAQALRKPLFVPAPIARIDMLPSFAESEKYYEKIKRGQISFPNWD